MAVNNTLSKDAKKNPLTITYKAGDADVKLSPQMVRDYLCNGDVENVTNQDIVLFMNLCKYQGLNPFLKEAYLVKYGKNPAQLITSKTALEKRAARCARYRGFEAGIIVQGQDGRLENRMGTFCLPSETLVGGWAKVYVEGFSHPVETAVSLREYSTGKALWASKPATMIRKVAKMQALREAFPNDMQGLYCAEEMSADTEDFPEYPIPEPADAPIETGFAEDAPVYEPDSFADIMEG